MKKYAIGIDLGATFVKFAIVNRQGKVRQRSVISTGAYKNKNALISAIIGSTKTLVRKSGFKKSQIQGVGIGVPGPVDSNKGIVRYLVNVKGWKEVDLKRIFEKKLGVSCVVDNDANAMALGEFLYGAGKGSCNMICVTLGTGVGGGIIINKKIYRGSSFLAGEIGHIPINEQGPLCNCGGKACIERYIGNRYLVQHAVSMIRSGKKSTILSLAGGKISNITPELLEKAARKGDSISKQIWNDAGQRLGIMLAGVINMLNPDKVVIGGGISKAGSILLGPVRQTINKRAMPIHARTCKVVSAKLGSDAGAVGAAALVWKLGGDHENIH